MRKEPKEIIKKYQETGSVKETANALNIHTSTVYRWLKRARSSYPYGKPRYVVRGLKRKSTRPKRIHHALSGSDRVAIEALRLERGYTAEKIKYITGISASVSTIQRYLKKRGHIRKTTRHRRPKCQDTVHMHAKNAKTVGYLQMDVKYLTPELTGLPWTCFEYAVMDIYSRYKDAVILNQLDQDGAIVSILEIVNRLPFKPVFIQTDNGLEFQSRFLEHCRGLGLKHHFIHKSSPNENAVIERSFRTDEEEFIYWKAPFAHYDDLRDKYAQYLHHYNHERPHLGIDLKTPMEMILSVANVVND
jgi:transposase InsO family protein